jgi:hypothetical protein
LSQAEAAFRRALAIQVTEAAQVGLLSALVRQTALTPFQTQALNEHMTYFRRFFCSREDIRASLAYVAWHLDDYELTKRASTKAVELKYPGWQAHFCGGTVYATGFNEDQAKAIVWLQEAKRRGGPKKAIDGFLVRLGVDPTKP